MAALSLNVYLLSRGLVDPDELGMGPRLVPLIFVGKCIPSTNTRSCGEYFMTGALELLPILEPRD